MRYYTDIFAGFELSIVSWPVADGHEVSPMPEGHHGHDTVDDLAVILATMVPQFRSFLPSTCHAIEFPVSSIRKMLRKFHRVPNSAG